RRIPDAQREHKQILVAFRSRDPDTVERAVREHNQSALNSYLQHLQATGEIQMEADCP
ncbi:MAG: FCD domain-containing protein, partial [Anaerolineae bacterium]|nr:FCD domain-containing protein [Anaerolineae bacterium]